MYLWQPCRAAHDNDPDAPMAKYFVIHDTSGPYYGHRAFPDDINTNPKVNNLQSFVCIDEWGKAHVVVNRMGDSLVNHDFSIPWRETKFEQAAEFGGALKGLFVHIEMIQPRRAGSGGGDGHSPDPAFTPAQYDRLALLYTIVSVRAGHWLIPAFHAALDADIRNGHDDPLNFKIDSFADSIDRLMDTVAGRGTISGLERNDRDRCATRCASRRPATVSGSTRCGERRTRLAAAVNGTPRRADNARPKPDAPTQPADSAAADSRRTAAASRRPDATPGAARVACERHARARAATRKSLNAQSRSPSHQEKSAESLHDASRQRSPPPGLRA